MKTLFRECNLRPERAALLEQCNFIVDRYQGMGLRLTLRQLYYQLVTRNLILNREQSYKAIGSLVSDGRLGGLIDWDAIEDRVRVPRSPGEFRDLKQLVEAALYSYRLPRWKGQDFYVELWVEKDALSGVLAPLASEYHVTLMVNRGYSSQSAMYEASQRFIRNQWKEPRLLDPTLRHASENRRFGTLLYLGDHDPSGEDMVRDIQDRLDMFEAQVEVVKIALTMDQVEEYDPPPNPAKMSDSRAQKYVDKHGDSSWEVDALPPEVLQQVVRREIESRLDNDMMQKIKDKEEQDKARLRKFVEGIE